MNLPKLKLKKKIYDVRYVEFLEEKTKELLDTQRENNYLRNKLEQMTTVFAHNTDKEIWNVYYDWVLHGWSTMDREERINEMDFAFFAAKRTDNAKKEFERFLRDLAELEEVKQKNGKEEKKDDNDEN